MNVAVMSGIQNRKGDETMKKSKEHPIAKYEKPMSKKSISKMTIGIRHALAVALIQAHLNGHISCPECKSKDTLPKPILDIDGNDVYTYYACKGCGLTFKIGEMEFMKKYYDLARNLEKLTDGMFSVALYLGKLDDKKVQICHFVSPYNNHEYIWEKILDIDLYPPVPYVLEIEVIKSV